MRKPHSTDDNTAIWPAVSAAVAAVGSRCAGLRCDAYANRSAPPAQLAGCIGIGARLSTTSAADSPPQHQSQSPPLHASPSPHQQSPTSSSSLSSHSTIACSDSAPFLSSTSLRHLILYRHAESLGNIGQQSAQELGDHNLSLSPLGFRQAEETGRRLTRSFFIPDPPAPPPLIFISPYTRTRQTLLHMLRGALCVHRRRARDGGRAAA